MPLYEKARIEAYLPDLPKETYRNLLEELDREFTYTFGGCTIVRDLDGSYLSHQGIRLRDRINLIYTDAPFSFQEHSPQISEYVDRLRLAAFEALEEEAVLVTVLVVHHAEQASD